MLAFLFALSLVGVECVFSFKHFTVKQCVIYGNCKNQTNSILIAIDGSGSSRYSEDSNAPKKYKSQIGVNHNKGIYFNIYSYKIPVKPFMCIFAK